MDAAVTLRMDVRSMYTNDILLTLRRNQISEIILSSLLKSKGNRLRPPRLYASGIFDLTRRLRNSMIPINDPNTLLTTVSVVAFTHLLLLFHSKQRL